MGQEGTKRLNGGTTGVHAPDRYEIPTPISKGTRSDKPGEWQNGETENTVEEDTKEEQGTVPHVMEKGQKLRIIWKHSVQKSGQCDTASGGDSGEELKLFQSLVAEQNVENSASSTVQCNTLPEHSM